MNTIATKKMSTIATKLGAIDWEETTASVRERGHALLDGVLDQSQCERLISLYDDDSLYRKTINMERYRFGRGQYRYFGYPLPPAIQELREGIYARLAPIANTWMEVLNTDIRYPLQHTEFIDKCRSHGQDKPTALILRYGPGGHNTLHQDLYGEVYFPFQIVLFLNEPGRDYTGGEFVLTEQVPRAQSKAIVLQPHQGDILILTTSFRPEAGTRGYYRVNVRHGVSEVHTGSRHTLGIIFHDALS
jgi:uncharacterized protein